MANLWSGTGTTHQLRHSSTTQETTSGDLKESHDLWRLSITDDSRWVRYSDEQYRNEAKNAGSVRWEPGPLGVQGTWKSGLTPLNAAKIPNLVANISDLVIAAGDAITGNDVGPQVPNQPWLDLYRRNLDWVTLGLWDTFGGVDDDFMLELYDRVLNPVKGGWRAYVPSGFEGSQPFEQ